MNSLPLWLFLTASVVVPLRAGVRDDVRRLEGELQAARAEISRLAEENARLRKDLESTDRSCREGLQAMRESQARLFNRLQELQSLVTRLQARLDEQEAAPARSAPTPTPAAAPGETSVTPDPAPVTGESPEEAYRRALSAYYSGDYEGALLLFRAFLQNHADHALAPNAAYWTGECLYSREAWGEAAAAFASVPDRWPQSEKCAAAFLKLGFCRERMGKISQAGDTYREVLQRWPGSEEARRAKDRLRALGLPTL